MNNKSLSVNRRFILYKLFSGMWFIGAIWLYFYRIYINDQQVGILDGLSFFIGLLAEVPSGALADMIGRKRLVFIGQVMAGIGLLTQALGSSFWTFFIGQTVLIVGISFTSGADEALFFSAGNFKGRSVAWRKTVTKANQFGLVGSVFALTLGGWLHSMQPRIPWLLTAITFFVSAAVVLSVEDSQTITRTDTSSNAGEYIRGMKDGFLYFVRTDLKYYLLLILSLQGLYYINGYGLLRPVLLDRFTFTPLQGSILVAVCSIVTIGVLHYLHKTTKNINEKKLISLVGLSAVLSLVLSVFHVGYFGALVIVFLYVGEHVLYPYMSDVLNKHSDERHRATVLSVASFIRMIPYVLLAPLIGTLNRQDNLGYFLLPWALVVAFSLIWYIRKIKESVEIELGRE